MISVAVSLGLSYMDVCMATILIYWETLSSDMPMYMIIIFEMHFFVCSTWTTSYKNTASKLQERISGILFYHFFKTLNQVIYRNKYMRHNLIERKGKHKATVNSYPSEAGMRQRMKSPSVPVMACCLCGTKPIPKQMLSFYQSQNKVFNFESKYESFHWTVSKIYSFLSRWRCKDGLKSHVICYILYRLHW